MGSQSGLRWGRRQRKRERSFDGNKSAIGGRKMAWERIANVTAKDMKSLHFKKGEVSKSS